MSAPRPTSEDLLGDWSSELEAVLYAPEVEEAIQEVRGLRMGPEFRNYHGPCVVCL